MSDAMHDALSGARDDDLFEEVLRSSDLARLLAESESRRAELSAGLDHAWNRINRLERENASLIRENRRLLERLWLVRGPVGTG